MTSADRIEIALAAQVFVERGLEPVDYRQLYFACINGRVPAMRTKSRVWTIALADIDLIAQIMGSVPAGARPPVATDPVEPHDADQVEDVAPVVRRPRGRPRKIAA